MSRCDINIEFERSDRTFRPGEPINGTVHLRVNQDTKCDGCYIEHFWQTHGRGNTDRGEARGMMVDSGEWKAGDQFDFPFSFVAPAGPPTYHGHYLNIDHYVQVRVSIPWAFDPSAKEEFLLKDGSQAYGHLPRELTQVEGSNNKFLMQTGGPTIGVIVLVAVSLMFLPLAFCLLPIALGLGAYVMKNMLAEKKIGKVNLDIKDRHVEPGQSVPVSIHFTPPTSSNLNGITAQVVGIERCVSGSGTKKSTHTFKIHEQMFELVGATELIAGKPVVVNARLPVPKTNSYTFWSHDNQLRWDVHLRVDIPLWPDWNKTETLIVRPRVDEPISAEIVDATVINTEAIPVTVIDDDEAADDSPPIESDQPESADASQSRDIPAEKEDPTNEQPSAAATDEQTVGTGSVAELTSVAEPPTPSVPTVDPQLKELLEKLNAVTGFGYERDEIVQNHTSDLFEVTLEVSRVDRTFGMTPAERFRGGRTVIGTIAGIAQEATVMLDAQKNAELDKLTKGDHLTTSCKIQQWDSLYKRPVFFEA